MKKILITLVILFISFPTFAEELAFNVLVRDESIVQAVRSEADNVWIKLTSEHLNDTITVKISNKNQDSYRTWFNDSTDLVSVGYRGNGVWSDRVHTKANFIEYWMDGKLILHLERK